VLGLRPPASEPGATQPTAYYPNRHPGADRERSERAGPGRDPMRSARWRRGLGPVPSAPRLSSAPARD